LTLALDQQLGAGLDALSIKLTNEQQQLLLDFMALLLKWNKVYNLTSIRQAEDMLTHHVMDCLAAVAAVMHEAPDAKTLLDVGSGGGLPSVVFAIVCPHLQVTAVDAVAKKAAFIETVAHTLKLPNLKGVHSRVELLEEKYDLVMSRAFASLKDFTAWSDKALCSGGKWAAMKGKVPEEEMAELPSHIQIQHIQTLEVPGVDAQRCLIWLERSSG
jgi:16S rRNA (guanine527-N7)-methyltransferase